VDVEKPAPRFEQQLAWHYSPAGKQDQVFSASGQGGKQFRIVQTVNREHFEMVADASDVHLAVGILDDLKRNAERRSDPFLNIFNERAVVRAKLPGPIIQGSGVDRQQKRPPHWSRHPGQYILSRGLVSVVCQVDYSLRNDGMGGQHTQVSVGNGAIMDKDGNA